MEMRKFYEHSVRIQTDDLDWEKARAVGLTPDEKFILTYFSDIESQTIVYLREILHTSVALEGDTIGFLSMWNYEEFFHGYALARLLKECGHSLEGERIAGVRLRASFTETLLAWGASCVSRLFSEEFPVLFMTWGAVNELTTLRGYEELGRQTANPVLKTLCERIAKQERRHFAWYYNSARKRLERSPKARRFTRRFLKWFWSPVGAGVKSPEEVSRLIESLFPGPRSETLADTVDTHIAALPGLNGLQLMGDFVKKSRKGFHPPHFTSSAAQDQEMVSA